MTKSTNVTFEGSYVSQLRRETRNGHVGGVIWLTGYSGSGKSTIARLAEDLLFQEGHQVIVLDGDNLRHGLNNDLGFSEGDRIENVRRTSYVAKMLAEAGFIVFVALISPYRSDRDFARRVCDDVVFLETFCSCPINTCEQRDPKGLYARARAGKIRNFTGISAPYEDPAEPEVLLETDKISKGSCVELLCNEMRAWDLIKE